VPSSYLCRRGKLHFHLRTEENRDATVFAASLTDRLAGLMHSPAKYRFAALSQRI
jgi:hypothetical protein